MTAPRPEFQKKVRSRVRELATDAEAEHPLTDDLDVREVSSSLSVTIVFRWWPHPKLRNPDDCERAILELLFHRNRLRVEQIVRALGNCDRGDFSRNTVRRRLYKLAKDGILSRSTRSPKGYDLDPSIRFEAMRRSQSA